MTTSIISAINEVRNAINAAKAEFTGRTWDCAADELATCIRKGRNFDGLFSNGMHSVNTYNTQADTRRWDALVDDMTDAEIEAIADEVRDEVAYFVSLEDELVEAAARTAAELGDIALERLREAEMWLDAGNFDKAGLMAALAEGELEKAAREEREFGDDTAWGPAVEACGELREAIKAAKDAEDDE
jgi:hypothetical protein